MLSRDKNKTKQVIIFSMEDFVTKNHLLRKIEEAVDFSVLYDIVEDLCCPDNGRPGIDPVFYLRW